MHHGSRLAGALLVLTAGPPAALGLEILLQATVAVAAHGLSARTRPGTPAGLTAIDRPALSVSSRKDMS